MFSVRAQTFVPAAAAVAVGAVVGFSANRSQNAAKGTSATLDEILEGITSIKTDLGLGATTTLKVDPIGNFPVLTVKHKSLSCKALKADPSLYAKYCNVKTPMGFTFDQAIQAGLDAPHLGVGIAAGEPASYEVYKDIMDVVIEGWHGYKPTDSHKSDMDYTHLNMTPAQAAKFDKHVVSTRIRAGRSIDTVALPPATDRKQRRLVETLLSNALASMPGDLAGKYYPLGGMTKQEEDDMQGAGFLFQKPSPSNVLANCGAGRDWPDARGIFHNQDKTFLVWVNEEDHMRCISMQDGGNVKQVFQRWATAINTVEASLNKSGFIYAYNPHLGYITTCPSNVGTGLRASVMLKLPKLYKKLGVVKLEELADSMGLQARGGRGEHSPPGPNGEFDISNKGRIGASEVELVQRMIDGTDKLIDMEEAA
ncbi:ATP:guanido phosphotransferase [Ochromonadaceae sp. CCMP2298]|nr:ATP:guanido phosphotransferase [Ochromonadaceae sp. CCMP2298]